MMFHPFSHKAFQLSSVVAALGSLLLVGCSSNLRLSKPLPSGSTVGSPAFQQTIGSVITPGFVAGNQIETLNNGVQIFPAMLEAIRQAKKTIDFETFIYYNGTIPKEFATALEERARAGVQVRLIMDAVGAAKSRLLRPGLTESGVQLKVFHSIWWLDFRRFNYRTHRKILVVDGREGFIGGVGIADSWDGDARTPEEWHDLHFRVRGPVVAQLQGAFSQHWFEVSHEILQGPDFFPSLPVAGTTPARCFASSPGRDRSAAELMFHLAIASARHSLLIENAYFLPDNAICEALVGAARRGVKVKIIVPGAHMDQKMVRRASRKRWAKLLAAGVEIYEYAPTMAHTKLLIADGQYVSIGSANLDPRSLWINDEANMDFLDRKKAAELTAIFNNDLRHSNRVVNAGHSVGSIITLPINVAETPAEPLL